MARQKWLKVINPLLLILLITQVASGFNGRYLGREAFELIHVGGALVITGLVLVHLVLNWNWVKASYSGRPASGKQPEHRGE